MKRTLYILLALLTAQCSGAINGLSIGVLTGTQVLINVTSERFDKEIDRSLASVPSKIPNDLAIDGINIKELITTILTSAHKAHKSVIRPAKDCGMVLLNTAYTNNLPSTLAAGVATAALIYAIRSTHADKVGKKYIKRLLKNHPHLKHYTPEIYAGLEAVLITAIGVYIAHLVNN